MNAVKIRAATLNVWALPDPIGHWVPQRMRAIGRRLPQLDLDAVAFQEVWTAQARRILIRAGREAGFGYVWHRSDTLNGSGLLVLSRLPLEVVDFERFALPRVPTRPDHPDYYGGKGFVRVRLLTPGGPVSLVATHLQARYRSDVRHQYRGYRVAQALELALALRSVQEPALVLGDFNFSESDPEYRIFTGLTGLRDAAVEIGRTEPTIFPGNPFQRNSKERRIDFVFLRDGSATAIRPLSTGRTFDDVFELHDRPASYSDHAGVLAELVLGGNVPRPDARGQREAAQLASDFLSRGRARAARRQRGDRLTASIGWAGALLAALSVRDPRVSRRRLLRAGLQGIGFAALAPGVAYLLFSEFFAPEELRIFDRLVAQLDQLHPAGAAPLG